jgi:hypothetical protein
VDRKAFSVERAREVAGDVWATRAPTGGSDTRNLDPKAMAVKQFHVRFNERELLLAQMVADMEDTSKQRLMRRIVREYCERKLKAAGVPHP